MTAASRREKHRAGIAGRRWKIDEEQSGTTRLLLAAYRSAGGVSKQATKNRASGVVRADNASKAGA